MKNPALLIELAREGPVGWPGGREGRKRSAKVEARHETGGGVWGWGGGSPTVCFILEDPALLLELARESPGMEGRGIRKVGYPTMRGM
jgi:hypothetical protein